MARKIRTRDHVIGDLGVNHVERIVLQCGYSMECVRHDYGTDAIVFTYSNTGEIRNGDIRIQVRATRDLKVLQQGANISLPVEVRHIHHWLNEIHPFFLVLYDASRDEAYWVYIQRVFTRPEWKERLENATSGTLNVHIPTGNRLNEGAVRQFSEFLNRILNQVEGVIWHGDDDW